MSRNPLRESAERKRDAALAEARRWSDFLRMMEEIDPSEAAAQREDVAIRNIARTNGEPVQRVRRAVAMGALVLTEMAAIEEIQKSGRAMPTRDLLTLMPNHGIKIGGLDPVATLSARLSRSRRLRNVRNRGWMLAEEIEPTDPPASDESVGSLFQPDMPGERPAGGGT